MDGSKPKTRIVAARNGTAEKKLAGVPGIFHECFTWIPPE
jgi:hypothetical protein